MKTNEELFDLTTEEWNAWIDDIYITPRQFFKECADRLIELNKSLVKREDWMSGANQHLLKYRTKAIEFYQEKIK